MGLLTREQLRSKAWRRLFRDVYADRALPDTHGLRCRGAALLIPAHAAIAGMSAAWIHGANLASPHEPVAIVIPPGHRFGPVSGLRISTAQIPSADIVRVAGIPITTPDRAAWDIALGPDVVESVVYLDKLAALGAITRGGLLARLASAERTPGQSRSAWLRARTAIRLFDPRAESPPESRLRVQMVLAGLPPAIPQFEVWDGDFFVARLDLAIPEHRIGVEYDGRWHNRSDHRFEFDHARTARLVALGWRIIVVTSDRLRNDLARLLADLRRAIA